MFKKAAILFIFLTTFCGLSAQTSDNDQLWNTLLSDIKVRYGYSMTYETVLPKPKFGKVLKELDGKEISIRGYFLPVDMTGDVFVLSYMPSNMCFFCSGAGIESIIELLPADEANNKFKDLKTDNYFEAKGTLKLNANNYEHLVYILTDAEFVKVIKK